MGHGNGTPVAVPEPGRVQALSGYPCPSPLPPYTNPTVIVGLIFQGPRVGGVLESVLCFQLGWAGSSSNGVPNKKKILYYFFYCVAVEEG